MKNIHPWHVLKKEHFKVDNPLCRSLAPGRVINILLLYRVYPKQRNKCDNFSRSREKTCYAFLKISAKRYIFLFLPKRGWTVFRVWEACFNFTHAQHLVLLYWVIVVYNTLKIHIAGRNRFKSCWGQLAIFLIIRRIMSHDKQYTITITKVRT